MSRSVGIVLVAVLVVLAGCNGALSGGSNKSVDTVTPTSTLTPTPTPVSQLAPGLTEEGIENASVLIAAHTSFLQNRSFTRTMTRIELASNDSAMAPNGSVIYKRISTLYESADERAYVISNVMNGYEYLDDHRQEVRAEAWSNSERLLLKITYADGTVRYIQRSLGNKHGILQLDIQNLRSFGIANTSVVKRFTKNGMKLYRVRGVKARENITVNLQLLVDSRGVIHEYQIKRNPSGNFPTEIHRLNFSNIGVTEVPKRPSWVDEAINQTTPIPEGTPTPTMPVIQGPSTTSAQAG